MRDNHSDPSSMDGVFRPEAIDYRSRRLEGVVVIASPLPTRLLTGLFATILVVGVGLASAATYSKHETVSGWIAPDSGFVRLTARQTGTVESMSVREGDQLRAGQSLAAIRLATEATSGDSGKALMRGLQAEQEANEARSRAARTKLQVQQREMVGRIDLLRQELAETGHRIEILEQRRAVADGAVARGEVLMANEYLSKAAVDQLRNAALSAAQDLSVAKGSAIQLRRQISDLASELAGLPSEIESLAAEAAQLTAENQQKQISADSQSWINVTAPVAGRVAAIPVAVGQTVASGSSIATLIPAGSQLVAELYVPSRSIGLIQEGDSVSLQYQAFPYQTFGAGRARVLSVTKTVLAPSDVAIPGFVATEPVFRVRAHLERPFVNAYGRQIPLQAGMLLQAAIVTDRRSLLEWLLDPLYAVGRRL